ncbi:hypothetical protein Phum_PHUM430780 [Pediculus humanus corporis]|uniref:Uncharacterized protein n=1 Tax=Pediculus humanus subsp. corporis TaxID=121224 RepID=E0VTC9_PEDHC|nr:uncharacterized protein Phum_PHUM430780 [Pediculus humanus corporis]EEB16635.1 hypothetical protein Phum_PHUM430780 [Pediculus humanus corporis]
MRWTLLVLSSAILVAVKTRSIHNDDYYGMESYGTKDIYDRKDRQFWNPTVYDKNLYNFINDVKEKNEPYDVKLQRKRALSALSRWKPLGNLGIRIKSSHRSSSRAPMISMVPEMNLISAESLDGMRPLGQPLRWGQIFSLADDINMVRSTAKTSK